MAGCIPAISAISTRGGNLFITGREKDVIVLSNGKNVYPEEIEAYYLKSPYIKEIGVMALESEPGNPASDRLYGVVVPNFDVLKERKIVNAKEVIRFDIESISAQNSFHQTHWQLRNLAGPSAPHHHPKTQTLRTGKAGARQPEKGTADSEFPFRRAFKRGRSAVAGPAGGAAGAEDNSRDRARLAPEVIRPSDNLELDLGLDSMQRVELLVAVEKELGGDVEESALAEIYTVRQLVDAIRESAAAGKTRTSTSQQPAGWKSVLQEDPTDPEVLPWHSPADWRNASCTRGLNRFQIFAYDRFHLRVSGLEKLPTQGPYIISSNHQSFLDPVILARSCRPVFRNLLRWAPAKFSAPASCAVWRDGFRVIVRRS